MSTANQKVRRLLGGMPTGANLLAGKEFTVIHRPAPVAQEPDLLEGFTLLKAAKAPFQDLDEAVERMIRLGVLR